MCFVYFFASVKSLFWESEFVLLMLIHLGKGIRAHHNTSNIKCQGGCLSDKTWEVVWYDKSEMILSFPK